MKTCEQILDECYAEHKPSLIIASYSGGYDSMVMTHKAVQWAKANNAPLLTIAVDTRLHADGWIEYITESAKALGCERLEIVQSRRFNEWPEYIRKGGFVYTPSGHTAYFRMLKEAAFRDVIQMYKKHLHDRIMMVTGMRRSESRNRANTPEYDRSGAGVWCNPLVYWNEFEIQSYRVKHNLPENPFYHHGLGSGDCQCNWHRGLTLENLNTYCTEAAKIILPLDAECRAKFSYGYGEEPSKLAAQEAAGQMPLFDLDGIPNLCAGCERPKPSQDAIDDILMQRMEW